MISCRNCQHSNPEDARFCANCGAQLTGMLRDGSSVKKDLAERRQLTILFCDLVDSTPLSERMDPEDYRQMILDYHDTAEEVIDRFGGKVGNYLGDGLLVYFGYPQGLENSAVTAVQTASGIINAIDKVRQKWESLEGVTVRIRVGIHTGLVVVDEHLALGETVNIAARLEGLAPYNGIVISPQTLSLIQGWFEVRSMGEKTLKGISDPMEVFEITGESKAQTRLDVSKATGLSPLVGREKELKLLHASWNRAKQGKGNAIMITGEAGIGKSRLSDKLEIEVQSDPESLVLEARCSMQHANSAFYPLLELIQKELLQISSSDDNKQRGIKLENYFDDHFKRPDELLLLFAEYIGISNEAYPPLAISPFAKREKFMKGASELLVNAAYNRSLLLVIEDLHWADASTIEWLELFSTGISDKAVFLLCTTRPHPRGDSENLPSIDHIQLKRLKADDMTSICLHQAHGKDLPPAVTDEIMSKTEGVPLFAEELTKMILASDQLIERSDRFELSGSLDSLEIPSTLQDSLLARLDQFKDIREIIQMGSVIGRSFSLDMLCALFPGKDREIETDIQRLLNAEIFQKDDTGTQKNYRFKHALIQDTAYGSMLRKQKKRMHGKVAGVIRDDFNDICENQPELLAHHYTEADQPLKAIPQWLRAGQRASKTNAAKEAIAHLEKGLKLLPEIEEETARQNMELDLRLTLGGSYMVAYGFPHQKVRETFDKAGEIARSMDVDPKLALIHFNLLSYYFNTEDYNAYDELLEHMSDLSSDPQNGYWFDMIITYFSGINKIVKGDVLRSLPYFEQAVEKFDPSRQFPWELAPGGYLPYANRSWQMIGLHLAGYNERTKQLVNAQLPYSDKEHQDSTTLYHVYTFPALYALMAREWNDAEEILEQYLPIAYSFGDPIFILTAQVYYQIAKFFQGDASAFQQAVQLINTCFDIGFKAFAVTMSAFIAEGYLSYERPGEAVEWIEKILAHVDQTGTHIQTAELYRLRARAMLVTGKSEKTAEEELNNALELAKSQGNRVHEIRAAIDIARLLHRQGKVEKGRQLLEDSYSSFSEGFDSVDLKDARETMRLMGNN